MNEWMIRLLIAIAAVESGGNPAAYNPKEDAAGLYQIRPIYLHDVNRILGRNVYTLDDRFNPEKSEEMVRVYLTFYGRLYQQRTGKKPTAEILARIHNGGPNGWKKESTTSYWEKVKKQMDKN